MRATASSGHTNRRMVHDVPINFRVAGHLLDAASRMAADKGMSLSELLRHALRAEISKAA